MHMNENNNLLVDLLNHGEETRFKKGCLVVSQENVLNEMYYIQKGIVRGYYIDENGKEVTKCFSAEGDVFSVEGFLYHRPASFYIECLEEVECIRLPYKIVQDWVAVDSIHTAFANEIIIKVLMLAEERAKLLLLSDAAERYERFCIDYKNIAGRIKQKYIASYLGINEASLCRIKRKIDLGQ